MSSSRCSGFGYVAGIEYNKVGSGASAIEMIHTEEGYLQNNSGTYTYHYNLTDHLGNVRAVLQRTTATTGTVIQKQDYYPFGKTKAIVTSGINKYLYLPAGRQAMVKKSRASLGTSWTTALGSMTLK